MSENEEDHVEGEIANAEIFVFNFLIFYIDLLLNSVLFKGSRLVFDPLA